MPTFVGVIQNTDPGSNAGVPGLQIPIGIGATSKLPVGLELDGPAGSDRAAGGDRPGARGRVRAHAAAALSV